MSIALTTSRLDRLAISVSGLCLVHCLATAILVGMLSVAGGILGSPLIHEVGLTIAILLGAVALGRGAITHRFILPAAVGALGLSFMAFALSLPHGGFETMWTVAGVLILALGHRLNALAFE